MPLEPSFGNIDDLNPDWPLGTDPLAEGDDHIRGIKASLQGNVTGDAAATQLLANALVLLATTANGIRVGVPGVVGRVAIEDNNDVEAVTLDAAAGGVSLNALVEDVVLALNATPTGGGGVPVFTGDPNGEAALYFDGGVRLATKTFGVDMPGTTFDMGQQTDNSIIFRLINLIGGLRIIVSSASGDPGFNQVDNAGVFEQTWVNMFRDAGVALNYNGSQRLATRPDGIAINTTISWSTGSGSPEGVVTANPGSLYSDEVSGSSLPLWAKNFSNGNTGWVSCDVSAP